MTLERIWKKDLSNIEYRYIWHVGKNKENSTEFYINKIHKRNDFRWVYPVHEVLEYTGENIRKIIRTEDIVLFHYPNEEKSRKNYLELLIQADKKYILDTRIKFYLAREYMYNKLYKDAITKFNEYLSIKNNLFVEEISTAYRYLGRIYEEMSEDEKAVSNYINAINTCNSLREPLVDLGRFLFNKKEYRKSVKYLLDALKISKKSDKYINEEFAYNEYAYDLLSLDYYYLGEIDKAIYYAKEALKIAEVKRIRDNLKIFESIGKN